MLVTPTSQFQNTIWQSSGGILPVRGKGAGMKAKLVVVTVLYLVFGLIVGTRAQVPAQQAQAPAGNRPAKAQSAARQNAKRNAAAKNGAATQTVAPDEEVVQLSPKNLPQDPIRDAMNKGIKEGMQAAPPPTKLVLKTVAGNSAHVATQNTAQNTVPNAPSDIETNAEYRKTELLTRPKPFRQIPLRL